MKQIFSPRKADEYRTFQKVRYMLLPLSMLFINPELTCSQEIFDQTAPSKYRIVFTDKDNSPYSVEAPEAFLSERAIERRQKQGIEILYNDLPVSPDYIDSLVFTGARLLTVSKWFNSATVEVTDDAVLNKIKKLSFVVKDHTGTQRFRKATETVFSGQQSLTGLNEMDYGPSWLQTSLHNGHLLHNKGFTGKNMIIAVIDAGFSHADTLPAFNALFENGQILGTRDFVDPGNNVYKESTHGMSVLSIIGSMMPGVLIGTAPDASFWLLRSEDGSSEYIIEEDNWIAAAEFADSAGADIINSSLGYSEFNDSLQNHSYSDMDGNTTRVSIGADMAASKGMLVVASAGNQGNSSWKYITAPADADSVLTVGAVDHNSEIALFSSRGPSSDQQVKPNVVALGQGVYVASPDGSFRSGNGTSFSGPVIAGLTACLWQANPDVGAMALLNAICESADRFYHPDDDYGFGIPDYNLANILLRATGNGGKEPEVMAFPNPFYNQLYIFFKTPVNSPVDVRLYDLAGKEVYHSIYPETQGRKFLVIDSDFERIQKGIYIIRIQSGNVSGNSKLIKY